MIFPAFDLAVSRWFADGSVFVLAEQPLLLGLRQFGLKGSYLIAGTMLLLLGLHILLPRRYIPGEPHKPLFVLMSFVASQLLVEVLKALIGRARPRHLLEFGGNAEFTPVWQFSAACARNCSFPSGEAAAAAAALSLLVFVPAGQRWTATIIMAPVLMMIALNRVLFGAHFLSDVVLGWMLTMLVMALVWKWTEPRSERIAMFFTKIRPSGRFQ
ncbi:phosphatase PAP2 family protein [Paracoccus sp. 12-3]|nr:phosphatase PAP2 family protein [Paracoccus xiamenensis]